MSAPELVIPVRLDVDKALKALVKLQEQGKKAGEETKRAGDEGSKGLDKAGKSAESLGTAVGGAAMSVAKMTAGMLGMSSVESVIGQISGHFAKIRQDGFKAAEDVLRMRGIIRELTALRGEMGSNGPTLAHVMSIAARTLQTPKEAGQMESAGLGIGELALGPGGNMTREAFEKAMIAAGRMQTMEGGPAEAYGAMMGQLAISATGPMTAEDAQAKLYKMFQIQQPGGFKNFGQAASQFAKIQPLIQSGVLTAEQGMSLLSTFSVASPEEAGKMVDSFVRTTMAGRLRERGMKVAEGVETQKSAAYMKSIGADKLVDPTEIGKRIAADLDEKRQAAAGRGEQFDVYAYLQTHGFNEQMGRDVTMLFAGMKNRGSLAKIEAAQNAPVEPDAIDKLFEKRLGKDLFLKGRAGQLSEQMAGTKQGMAEEPLVAAQRAAFARLKSQGKISGTFEKWRNQNWLQSTASDLFFGGSSMQVAGETALSLGREGRCLGIKVPEKSGFGHDETADLARRVRDAGGDVTAGVTNDLAAAAADLREAARELKGGPAVMQPAAPAQGNR
jgi:hypothetical protein